MLGLNKNCIKILRKNRDCAQIEMFGVSSGQQHGGTETCMQAGTQL